MPIFRLPPWSLVYPKQKHHRENGEMWEATVARKPNIAHMAKTNCPSGICCCWIMNCGILYNLTMHALIHHHPAICSQWGFL